MARILFVANRLNWPRDSGTDVHGSQMMRALAARGHDVSLATFATSPAEAVAGLGLADVYVLLSRNPSPQPPPRSGEGEPSLFSSSPLRFGEGPGEGLSFPSRLQSRFERYWGTDSRKQHAIASLTQRETFDAVVVLGADALPLFRGIRARTRVWYAADDAALHHWSRVKLLDPRSWKNLKLTAIHALYERAFAGLVDRVWVVSDADRRAMRFATGLPVDVIANGVDSDHFRPLSVQEEIPDSCAFWGRLDFGPNEDAVAWFLQRCWPHVRATVPTATLSIFGFRPSPRVTALCHSPGVELIADLPDLRGEVCRRAVTVLPFVSGRGIKNKLLEAAAMGRPIACTPQALTGCRGVPPVRFESNPKALASAIVDLFRDADSRTQLGTAAREWVTTHHSWDAAAANAERSMFGQHERTPLEVPHG